MQKVVPFRHIYLIMHKIDSNGVKIDNRQNSNLNILQDVMPTNQR